ncbi:hypothetical protein IBX38_02440 [Candidatus Bathyarchaeota archaeon]|nr:hypothetical protein [Candidatus Bathyarchaeota archaeon]
MKKIRSTKALKLLGLLISSILIATVSAALYDYMYLDADVSVEGIALAWVNGTDGGTAGTQISGLTATLTNLKGPPNGTRVYPDPVRLNNTGGSSVTFNITVSAVTGATANMSSIIVRIYNMTNSASIRNVTVWNVTTGTSETGLSIGSEHEWRFQWEITWKAIAVTNDTVTVNLKLEVPTA